MPALRLPPLALLMAGIAASASADTGSFYALFYDGSHVSVPVVNKDVWSSDEATVGGRRLFGTETPVRMLQDMAPRAALKGPRVVMANGDVLPGKIVGFLPASPTDDTPARLLIPLDGSLVSPDPRGLVVRADRVLRVTPAAGPTSDAEPGAIVLADGTRLIASAMRWSDQGLKALTRERPHADRFRYDLGTLRAQGGRDAGRAGRQLLSSLGTGRGDRQAGDGPGSRADLLSRNDAGRRQQGFAVEPILARPAWLGVGHDPRADRFHLAAELS